MTTSQCVIDNFYELDQCNNDQGSRKMGVKLLAFHSLCYHFQFD